MKSNEVTPDDWHEIIDSLNFQGFAVLPKLLTNIECFEIQNLYDGPYFRSRVVMERHGFGKGEYKYFSYPLPDLINKLRHDFYEKLVSIANHWNKTLNIDFRFPPMHKQYIDLCRANNQIRPTPLLLKYEEGDYNCLHQDIYGDQLFPIQMAILLSRPDQDFEGGEFVLTEQRPRMQSKVQVVNLKQGDAVIFAVNSRPVQGTRGFYKVNMRHGVSELLSGKRFTMGIIFHDAT